MELKSQRLTHRGKLIRLLIVLNGIENNAARLLEYLGYAFNRTKWN